MLASFRCFPLLNTELGLVLVLVAGGGFAALGQGTVFTYQGHLNDGGKAATGQYHFRFELFDQENDGSSVKDPIVMSSVSVSNGLLTAALDFGSVFDGNPRWLEVSVRNTTSEAFTTMTPRQALQAAPYAMFAGGVKASGITGTISPGNLARESITPDMLSPGAAAANLPAGTMVLSSDLNATNLIAAGYSRVGGQLDLSWEQRGIDSPRSDHTAVWTSGRLIVWGGALGAGSYLNTGGSVRPSEQHLEPGHHQQRAPKTDLAHRCLDGQQNDCLGWKLLFGRRLHGIPEQRWNLRSGD